MAALEVQPLAFGSGVFDDAGTPSVYTYTGGPYVLGSDFTNSGSGLNITGVQFWKVSTDTGTHNATVFRKSDQANLASVAFSGETASGWQTVTLPTPVTMTAGATYRVCVSRPSGYGYIQPGVAQSNGTLSMAAVSFWISGASGYPNTADAGGANYAIDVVVASASTALDFPNPPLTANQTYAASNGVTYTWDGAAWVNYK